MNCKWGKSCFLQTPEHLELYHEHTPRAVGPIVTTHPVCRVGDKCKIQDPGHIKTFHPTKCPFGKNCHRANPQHVKKYHPGKKFSIMYF
jgi:hypothetical protein